MEAKTKVICQNVFAGPTASSTSKFPQNLLQIGNLTGPSGQFETRFHIAGIFAGYISVVQKPF